MNEGKTSISQASSYEEMGEFWDMHDLADYWDQTAPAEFTVNLQSSIVYYALDRSLEVQLTELARQRGVPPGTLLNLLVQEKLQELQGNSAA
jgi:hypothetical protein